MNILFITQWFDPEPGAIRGLPLARWLKRQGHDVQVITAFPNYPGGKIYPGYSMSAYQWEEMGGEDRVPVLRVPIYPNHNASALKRIVNYLSYAFSSTLIGLPLAKKPDVVYVYHPPPTVALAALVLKAVRGIPYVYHIADMWPESVLESGMVPVGGAKKLIEGAINRWCNFVYRHAQIITVLSPGFKRLLIERGVRADKIRVVYNWTEEDIFRPVPADAVLAQELGLAGRFNVIYAGNLGAFQALERVIEAAKLLENHPHIQIVLAGAGQRENVLKEFAHKLQCTNVRFLGRREYWEMPQINALADVLLVHLRDLPFFKTTVPSKTQVSLASGKAVLMAVGGDASDIISQSGGGINCAPENPEQIAAAILKLSQMSPDERNRMGARGRDFYLREMSLERGGELMLDIFAEVTGQQSSSQKGAPQPQARAANE